MSVYLWAMILAAPFLVEAVVAAFSQPGLFRPPTSRRRPVTRPRPARMAVSW